MRAGVDFVALSSHYANRARPRPPPTRVRSAPARGDPGPARGALESGRPTARCGRRTRSRRSGSRPGYHACRRGLGADPRHIPPQPVRKTDANELEVEDPHGHGDETPALTTRTRFTSSRPPRGRVRTVLHIRSGLAGGGSAESCGNTPAFNGGEILPCAQRALCTWEPAHWKPTFQKEPRNHEENPQSARGGAAVRCATSPQSAVRPDGPVSRAPPAPAPWSASGMSCACGGRDGRRQPAGRGKWRSGRIIAARTR